MISDLVLAYLTYICLKCHFNMKKNITGVNTVLVIFYVKRTFTGYACQMNVKYTKNISEIMKNYKIKKKAYTFSF